MTTMTRVPVPGEVDPEYADQAPFLKSWLAQGRHDPVVVLMPETATVSAALSPDPFGPEPEKRMLSVRRCRGPAAYVGRPFWYEWRVLVDDDGRMVAGEAEILYTMDEDTYEQCLAEPSLATAPGMHW